ncbi:hypothetical protein JIN84_06845 [Luteolibacter yonseiensis]|uniref:Peptidase n=1 Tax=Luteolibacter yonseiensis TaxID=1144680 RepID=A0A934R3D0_9BACT|nr:leishmanolysin-related zinc metalloendopeptidase [Luteolibacter yonseiensis]MBK1815323.1 hypothetical protein [Luteolibacter yonseiensis]
MKSIVPAVIAVLSAHVAHAASLISLEFSGPMTPIQQQTFVDAADFWNSVILGYDLVSDANGSPTPHSLTVSVSIPFIDGSGGVLGSAGPENLAYYDNDPFSPNPTVALYYAATGSMSFDSADVAGMVADSTFYGVVLHEMAHVLGIGTLWTFNNNVNGTSYELYADGSGQYTGPNALARWQSEFNQPSATYVPVELGGGPGTANGHWNENNSGVGNTGFVSNLTGMDLSNELMTGWASNTFFISEMTLGALDDLGYIVDYSKAGVVDHIVVPELTSLVLCLGAVPLMMGRRRPGRCRRA